VIGMQRKMFAGILLILAPASGLFAQVSRADPVDLQARFGAQLKLNLPKKLEGSIGYELRMIGNASNYHGSYFDGELGRPFGEYVTLFGNYRLARITSEAVAHRFGLGGEIERKMDRLSVGFRPMFQYQEAGLDDAEQGSSQAVRTRMKVKVPAGKRVTLHGSVEPYFAFTGVYPVDNWRNTVGAQWEFMKDRKVDLYYIYRPDYSKPFYNRTYHIVGAEFSTEIKLPREKKKGKKK
jgi:hypothetical protein